MTTECKLWWFTAIWKNVFGCLCELSVQWVIKGNAGYQGPDHTPLSWNLCCLISDLTLLQISRVEAVWGKATWEFLAEALYLSLGAAIRLGFQAYFLPEQCCTYSHTQPHTLLIWLLTMTCGFDFLAWPQTCLTTMDLSINLHFCLTLFFISRPANACPFQAL